jgi:hypothetical protein
MNGVMTIESIHAETTKGIYDAGDLHRDLCFDGGMNGRVRQKAGSSAASESNRGARSSGRNPKRRLSAAVIAMPRRGVIPDEAPRPPPRDCAR